MTAAISAVVLRLTTQNLGPTRYGYLTTAVAVVSIFSLLADLGLTTITSRDLARHPERTSSILTGNLSLRVFLSVLAIPLISAIAYMAYPSNRATVVVGVLILSVDILLNAVSNTLLTYFASRTRNDVIALVILTGKLVYLAAVVVATVIKANVFSYIAAYLVGDFIGAAVAVVLVTRRVRVSLTVDLRAWWTILRRSFPLGILQVIGNIYLWTGSICLSLFQKPADVAFYGLCTGFIFLLILVSAFFMSSLIPTLSTAKGKMAEEVVQHAWDIMIYLGAGVALGAIVLRRTIVVAVAGPSFAQSATPLAILGVVAMLMYVNNVISFSSVAFDRYRALLAVQLPSIVLQVALNLILVPRLGVNGASIAILCSEVASLIGSSVVFRRRSGIVIDYRHSWRPLVAAAIVLPAAELASSAWSTTSVVGDTVLGALVVGALYALVAEGLRATPSEIVEAAKATGKRLGLLKPL